MLESEQEGEHPENEQQEQDEHLPKWLIDWKVPVDSLDADSVDTDFAD